LTQRSEIDWSRLGLSLVAAAVLSTFHGQSSALSFGAEQVSSSLGQPLSVSIPLLGATGDSLETACFRLVAPSRSDGIPSITQARIELQSSSSPPRLLIRGARAIDEPIVRITLEAGCDTPIRRDYTILLDPPALKVPESSPASLAASAAAASRASTSAADAAIRDRDVSSAPTASKAGTSERKARSAQSGSTGAATSVESPRKKRDGAPATPKPRAPASAVSAGKTSPDTLSSQSAKAVETRDQLQVQGGPAGAASSVDAASLAALAIPRLKISSELPSFAATPSATPQAGNELQTAIANERRARLLASPIEEDLAPRLEADLVVAKRRLAELHLQLGNAGSPSSAASNAAAKDATKAAVSSPKASVSVQEDFDWLAWLWVPAAALVAGLVGFLVRQRRLKRQASVFDATEPVTVVHTEVDEFDTVMPATTVALTMGGQTVAHTATSSGFVETSPAAKRTDSKTPVVDAKAERAQQEATDTLNSPLFQLQDTASQVDVSVLSQATDEAQVYADLGRTDQAISILRNHIQNLASDRASPVPWLMIFDLYRRTNNRAGYDELAPQFRKHFNGRMPDWDSYGHELALDDGLEAFPHLVARIERDWGKPEARKFLDELLYDNRGGSRLGFSLAAYRDLLLLLQVHDVLSSLPPTGLPEADWESRGANDEDGTPSWDLDLNMIEPPKSGELDSFLKGAPKA
jgi:pilus assembly protein FimV